MIVTYKGVRCAIDKFGILSYTGPRDLFKKDEMITIENAYYQVMKICSSDYVKGVYNVTLQRIAV